jgi:hypothetical protein
MSAAELARLPGLAWRTYMGLTVLPAALALWRQPAP